MTARKPVKRLPRVEKDRCGGWIARDASGAEIFEEGFRWNSRSVARAVAREADVMDAQRAADEALTERLWGA